MKLGIKIVLAVALALTILVGYSDKAYAPDELPASLSLESQFTSAAIHASFLR